MKAYLKVTSLFKKVGTTIQSGWQAFVSGVKAFGSWWAQLGHELYVIVAGAATFISHEPLSSLLAVVTIAGICLAGALKSAPAAAAVLMASTMLFGMLQYRLKEMPS